MDDFKDLIVANILAGAALFTWWFLPNFARARAQGRLTECKSQLKNVGTAIEMYSTDWSGRYPRDIALITPKYLKTIPTCPAARRDTYRASYQSHSAPDNYTIFCSGTNHLEAGFSEPDQPIYRAYRGSIERP